MVWIVEGINAIAEMFIQRRERKRQLRDDLFNGLSPEAQTFAVFRGLKAGQMYEAGRQQRKKFEERLRANPRPQFNNAAWCNQFWPAATVDAECEVISSTIKNNNTNK